MDTKKLLTIKQMSERYPIFTEAALRRLILSNKHNIKKTMIKVGNKVFFDAVLFDEWLEERRMDKD